MYVWFMVTLDDGYFTRNMQSKQYNVDTLHLSVYIYIYIYIYLYIPHIKVAVRNAAVMHNSNTNHSRTHTYHLTLWDPRSL
jgi:hypothetical protein